MILATDARKGPPPKRTGRTLLWVVVLVGVTMLAVPCVLMFGGAVVELIVGMFR